MQGELIKRLALIAATIGALSDPLPAFGQDQNAANFIMPGCRSFTTGNRTAAPSYQSAYLEGYCVGIIKALIEAEKLICAPAKSTQGQWVRVVVEYIDRQPARLHEDFVLLAWQALISAWPCKK